MFIEAIASLKGGKKKLRELLDTVLEEYEQAQQMREVWATKAEIALEAKELIEQKLGRESPELVVGDGFDIARAKDALTDSIGE